MTSSSPTPLTDTNQDHRQVAEEAARVFKAHATLLAGEFPNNDLGGFTPQVYVALSAREVDAKAHMVAHYRSQEFGGRPYLDAEVVRALARLRGSQIRERAAEAFAVLRACGDAAYAMTMTMAQRSRLPPAVTVLVAAYNEAPVIGDVVRKALRRRAVRRSAGGRRRLDRRHRPRRRRGGRAGASVLPRTAARASAVRRGLPERTGEVIVLIDGDGQDDPAEIPRLLEALRPTSTW